MKCRKRLLNACSTNTRHHNSHLSGKGRGLAHFAGQYGTGISDNDYKSHIRFSQCILCGTSCTSYVEYELKESTYTNEKENFSRDIVRLVSVR